MIRPTDLKMIGLRLTPAGLARLASAERWSPADVWLARRRRARALAWLLLAAFIAIVSGWRTFHG